MNYSRFIVCAGGSEYFKTSCVDVASLFNSIQFISYKPCTIGTLVPATTVLITRKRECGTYNQALEVKACSVCSEIG
ncbi:hypothetical protein CSKR_103801 [Clonorchis sinensis]|uniref:Uncharacterized protein n=1 Tax=Clonorchis sinensis TaxID=79923 RepID=A0A419PYG1_CLOSI|nr:hypothetical protein CSKR_103801 [Clonorchis sinensis]